MVWQLLFLGVALGMNNALASVALGTMNMKRSHQLRTALLFGLFEALMPVIGLLIGEELAGFLGDKARFIGVAVLAVLGIYLLLKSSEEQTEAPKALGMQSLLLGLALSLDNLTVGFGLGMLNVPIGLAAITFGIISLIMTLVGLEIGRFLGSRLSISADKLSGGVLLLIALVMLMVH
jgi:manganese efflux pump family protein